MRFLRDLADYRRPGSPANRLRRRRVELFESLLAPLPRPLRILDVGGLEEFWTAFGLADEPGIEIVLLNLTAEPTTRPNIESLAGDARSMPQFRDNEFEVVFSNSVIEHVGDWPDQQRMAAEIKRIARRYFVQTPNRWFPIEPHFLTPGFQFLPLRVRIGLVRRVPLGHTPRIPDPAKARDAVTEIRLLTRREIAELFPEANLYEERILGLTKSFVAYAGFERSGALRRPAFESLSGC